MLGRNVVDPNSIESCMHACIDKGGGEGLEMHCEYVCTLQS